MSDVTIKQLAGVLGMSVDKLLTQLDGAGMKFSAPDQVVSSTEKVKLLASCRRTHGKIEKKPRTVRRGRLRSNGKTVSELTVNQGAARGKTVNVEVRQKRTYVKRSTMAEGQDVDPEREDRAEEIAGSQAQAVKARSWPARIRIRRRFEEEAKLRAAEEARSQRRSARALPEWETKPAAAVTTPEVCRQTKERQRSAHKTAEPERVSTGRRTSRTWRGVVAGEPAHKHKPSTARTRCAGRRRRRGRGALFRCGTASFRCRSCASRCGQEETETSGRATARSSGRPHGILQGRWRDGA